MVTRLSGIDALSLHTQSAKTPAHTLTLIIIDASDQLSHQRLHQLVATSLQELARFRSRLVTKPQGVGQPVWAEIWRAAGGRWRLRCRPHSMTGPRGQRPCDCDWVSINRGEVIDVERLTNQG